VTKGRNFDDSLVIRINSADSNSCTTLVSALSRYDLYKHGCTMYVLRLCLADFVFRSSVVINVRKNTVGLCARKNVPVLLLPLNYL
jgi:hypothetical protein